MHFTTAAMSLLATTVVASPISNGMGASLHHGLEPRAPACHQHPDALQKLAIVTGTGSKSDKVEALAGEDSKIGKAAALFGSGTKADKIATVAGRDSTIGKLANFAGSPGTFSQKLTGLDAQIHGMQAGGTQAGGMQAGGMAHTSASGIMARSADGEACTPAASTYGTSGGYQQNAGGYAQNGYAGYSSGRASH